MNDVEKLFFDASFFSIFGVYYVRKRQTIRQTTTTATTKAKRKIRLFVALFVG